MKQEKKAQEQNSALTPQESAAELRLKHDLIETEGILAATRGRHAIHCLTVIGTIEGHTLAPEIGRASCRERV